MLSNMIALFHDTHMIPVGSTLLRYSYTLLSMILLYCTTINTVTTSTLRVKLLEDEDIWSADPPFPKRSHRMAARLRYLIRTSLRLIGIYCSTNYDDFGPIFNF